MPIPVRRLFASTVVVSIMLALAAGAPAQAASSPASTLKSLAKKTNALPSSVVTKKQKAKLRTAASHASKVAKKKPCSAVSDLSRFRRVLRSVKIKRGSRFAKASAKLAALGPQSLTASQKLLADKRTKRCGGGVTPSTSNQAQTSVLKSDENGLTVRVSLPELHFVPETGGGRTWSKLVVDNTDSPGSPGSPGIPTISNTLGVPDGAALKVTATNSTSQTVDGVDVFPAQPEPVDGISPAPNFQSGPFAQPPFKIDAAAYAHKGLLPASPADGGVLGQARDITVGNLQVPSAQYDPAGKKLKVLKTVDVNVEFQGGGHTFSEELASPYEQAQRRLAASLLNSSVVSSKFKYTLRRCGEEMLVITNPSTRPAADSFATARDAAGLRTVVVETGAGLGQIGTTPAAIQTFIRAELTRAKCIHPTYVTIMGDDDLVPTFPGIDGIPSDLEYSLKNGTDELPDVAVGRMIGDNQAKVQTIVNKTIGYETNPPGSPAAFPPQLRHATIAAQFQDVDGAGQVNDGQENRTFTQFAETVRNGLVARGLTVDRIYKDNPTTTPLKFNDGTNLPASLKKPTFAWNGTGADVTTAWNAGRFLVIHRDHGWSDGWGDPGYGTGDVQGLTNGTNLPVLMSINCASAQYDTDETSFVGESLVNPNGGAVGAFGDTRNSPSWHNSQIGLGFVDGLLPSVLPAEGPASKQRMGDALINGKLRLAGLAPPGADHSTRQELYLWHYFGDPSMQMWGGDPPLLVSAAQVHAIYKPGPISIVDPPPPYHVEVTLPAELNGQPISLLNKGEVVGKGIAGDGKVTIEAEFGDGSVKPGDLKVAAEGDGAVPVQAPVQGVPEDTSMSQTCPTGRRAGNSTVTVSGNLSPAFEGAAITVTWTRPDGTTFTRNTTTDAKGGWSNAIVPDNEDGNAQGHGAGTWKAHATFAGDSAHNGSSTSDCTIDVFDNS
jgi:hypothetical protein